MGTKPLLPDNFLSSKGPAVHVERIDFTAANLPEYAKDYAVVLDNVFTAEECRQLVAAAEAATTGGWERAMVNVGNNEQMHIPDVRNCDRIIWDDRAVVAKLWNRVAEHVPEVQTLFDWEQVTGKWPVKLKQTYRFTRLNERMRFLRYGPGEYFAGEKTATSTLLAPLLTSSADHCDGMYETPDKTERSYFTLHLYLNESTPDNKLMGGATTFHSWRTEQDFNVKPKIGRVLIFQHKNLRHSGEEVLEGLKLTLRTDLMFQKD